MKQVKKKRFLANFSRRENKVPPQKICNNLKWYVDKKNNSKHCLAEYFCGKEWKQK